MVDILQASIHALARFQKQDGRMLLNKALNLLFRNAKGAEGAVELVNFHRKAVARAYAEQARMLKHNGLGVGVGNDLLQFVEALSDAVRAKEEHLRLALDDTNGVLAAVENEKEAAHLFGEALWNVVGKDAGLEGDHLGNVKHVTGPANLGELGGEALESGVERNGVGEHLVDSDEANELAAL